MLSIAGFDPAPPRKVSRRAPLPSALLAFVLGGQYAPAMAGAGDRPTEGPPAPAEPLATRILERAATVDHNGSYLQIDSLVRFEERADPAYDAVVRAKLDLPRTERRFKLILETDEAEGEPGGDPADVAGDPIEAAADNPYRLALRYLAHQTRRINLNFDAGLRFDAELQFFTRARAGGTLDLADWAARLSQTLTWRSDDGWLSASRLDLDRPIHQRLFFRASTEANWAESTERFDLSQDLVLFQQIDSRNRISYRVGARGASEPVVAASGYLADLRYRHLVHRQWLYLDIRPAVDWRRDQSFEPVHSVTFTLSAIFSER